MMRAPSSLGIREMLERRASRGDRAGEERVWSIVKDAAEAYDIRNLQLMAHVFDAIHVGELKANLKSPEKFPNWREPLPRLARRCREGSPLVSELPLDQYQHFTDALVVRVDDFVRWLRERGWAPPVETDSRPVAAPRSRRRGRQMSAALEALAALFPDAKPVVGTVKQLTVKINGWIRERGASEVSEDTVSRALKAYSQTQKPQG